MSSVTWNSEEQILEDIDRLSTLTKQPERCRRKNIYAQPCFGRGMPIYTMLDPPSRSSPGLRSTPDRQYSPSAYRSPSKLQHVSPPSRFSSLKWRKDYRQPHMENEFIDSGTDDDTMMGIPVQLGHITIGRGDMLKISSYNETQPDKDRELERQIRRTMGAGYSNELIEEHFKNGAASSSEDEEQFTDAVHEVVSENETSGFESSSPHGSRVDTEPQEEHLDTEASPESEDKHLVTKGNEESQNKLAQNSETSTESQKEPVSMASVQPQYELFNTVSAERKEESLNTEETQVNNKKLIKLLTPQQILEASLKHEQIPETSINCVKDPEVVTNQVTSSVTQKRKKKIVLVALKNFLPNVDMERRDSVADKPSSESFSKEVSSESQVGSAVFSEPVAEPLPNDVTETSFINEVSHNICTVEDMVDLQSNLDQNIVVEENIQNPSPFNSEDEALESLLRFSDELDRIDLRKKLHTGTEDFEEEEEDDDVIRCVEPAPVYNEDTNVDDCIAQISECNDLEGEIYMSDSEDEDESAGTVENLKEMNHVQEHFEEDNQSFDLRLVRGVEKADFKPVSDPRLVRCVENAYFEPGSSKYSTPAASVAPTCPKKSAAPSVESVSPRDNVGSSEIVQNRWSTGENRHEEPESPRFSTSTSSWSAGENRREESERPRIGTFAPPSCVGIQSWLEPFYNPVHQYTGVPLQIAGNTDNSFSLNVNEFPPLP